MAKDSMTLNALATRPPSSEHPLLVVGNRISRRSATALRDAGIQFIDRLGNAFITFGDVLVEVQGRTEHHAHASDVSDSPLRPSQPSNLFSTRRSQVILALLTWPGLRTAGVRAIAGCAGVSVGQVHDTLGRLEQAGFLTPRRSDYSEPTNCSTIGALRTRRAWADDFR